VNESTRVLVLFILILILLIIVALAISNFMMRRAIMKVIRILREGDALTPETARTAEELGIKRNLLLQLKIWRDFKPAALNLLITANVVLMTEDGRIFLSEENLSRTRFGQQRGWRK
jgi:hypothetical protein